MLKPFLPIFVLLVSASWASAAGIISFDGEEIAVQPCRSFDASKANQGIAKMPAFQKATYSKQIESKKIAEILKCLKDKKSLNHEETSTIRAMMPRIGEKIRENRAILNNADSSFDQKSSAQRIIANLTSAMRQLQSHKDK